MQSWLTLSILFLLAITISCTKTPKTNSTQLLENGTNLYNHYCLSCHGEDGRGSGPAAEITVPKPRDFTSVNWQQGATDEQLQNVIEKGGAALGLSSFMPAWQNLLTSDEIKQVIAKIRSFAQLMHENKTDLADMTPSSIFSHYCSGCHGGTGQGNGIAATKIGKTPPDFTNVAWQRSVSDQHIKNVIRKGGPSVGKSSCMPAWGTSFDLYIDGLVDYVRHFAQTTSDGGLKK